MAMTNRTGALVLIAVVLAIIVGIVITNVSGERGKLDKSKAALQAEKEQLEKTKAETEATLRKVPKTVELVSSTETSKGGLAYFHSVARWAFTRPDGFKKEIPFTQLDLTIFVKNTDDPKFSWAYLPGRNELEAKGEWEEKKDKLEWRKVPGGQTVNTSYLGKDASEGGTFIFWNANFADPITYTFTVKGTFIEQ